jgi:DNA polymerase III subunit delta'
METNWGIIGHSWAVESLRQSITREHIAHAYLLMGPAGIGKATLARRLAQALICERATGEPCLECRACKRAASGNHPDVRMISLATQHAAQKADEAKGRELKIDTVREWQRDIDLRPFEACRRVFVLDDADKLTDQAANAMLKTLEEPPPYAVLILIAHGAGDLLPTIVSRCRVLRLRPVSRRVLADALERQYQLAAGDAALLAAWSGGRAGWAIAAVNDPERIEWQQTCLEGLLTLRGGGRAARLKWAEERAKEYRTDQPAVMDQLQLWQTWWRDVLLVACGTSRGMTYLDRRAEIEATASTVSATAIHGFLRHIDQTREQLADNVNAQLAFENLALHLP